MNERGEDSPEGGLVEVSELAPMPGISARILRAAQAIAGAKARQAAEDARSGSMEGADKKAKKAWVDAMGVKLEKALAILDPEGVRAALAHGALSVPETGHGRFAIWLEAAKRLEVDKEGAGESLHEDKKSRLEDCLELLDNARCPLFVRNNQHLRDIARSMAQGGKKLSEARMMAANEWLGEGDGYPPSARAALCKRARAWSLDGDQESRFDRKHWLAAIEKKCSKDSFGLACSMLEPTILAAGWEIEASAWASIADALLARSGMARGNGMECHLAKAISATKTEFEKHVADKLMCRALWADDLDLMSAVARGSPSLGSSASAGAAKQLGVSRLEGERPRSIPWIHIAVWCKGSRAVAASPGPSAPARGECLAALEQVQELLDEARERPCPEALATLDRKSLLELWKQRPEWLAPDPCGRTIFHVLAQRGSLQPVARGWKDIMILFGAGMWSLALSKNSAGESGLELLKARLPAQEKTLDELREALAKWEADEICRGQSRLDAQAGSPLAGRRLAL